MHNKIIIQGGNSLYGEIKISGAKNSALPIIIASILAKKPIILKNIPNITDIQNIISILQYAGVGISYNANTLEIIPSSNYNTDFTNIPSIVGSLRASVLLIGAMLVCNKKIEIPLPGGCAIGSRPIDLHLNAFKQMGANIAFTQNTICLSIPKNLQGTTIKFPFPSVGATENILIAASLADGNTTIENAAMEPEIIDLGNFLNKIGAKISGIGTPTIKIQGVNSLSNTEHTIIYDRIEAASYALATIITNGEVELIGKNLIQKSIKEKIKQIGGKIIPTSSGILISASDFIIPTDIHTLPYPGFPSDMQSQFTAILTLARGKSVIQENIFENRFLHVAELKKMGADIDILDKKTIAINGIKKLKPTNVKATDLRSAMALVIAALSTEGKTFMGNSIYLDRGYEDVEKKLNQCGALISREKSTQNV